MIRNARKLLKLLKKAQQVENGHVFLHDDGLEMWGKHPETGIEVHIPLKGFEHSAYPMLSYLIDKGLVVQNSFAYAVTPAGWHYSEEQLSAFVSFLIQSVAVPIVVSIVTTLLTMWISSFFR